MRWPLRVKHIRKFFSKFYLLLRCDSPSSFPSLSLSFLIKRFSSTTLSSSNSISFGVRMCSRLPMHVSSVRKQKCRAPMNFLQLSARRLESVGNLFSCSTSSSLRSKNVALASGCIELKIMFFNCNFVGVANRMCDSQACRLLPTERTERTKRVFFIRPRCSRNVGPFFGPSFHFSLPLFFCNRKILGLAVGSDNGRRSSRNTHSEAQADAHQHMISVFRRLNESGKLKKEKVERKTEEIVTQT